MKLDCTNLQCPEPVIKTKNALENIDEGILEVSVNSKASKQNVKRFASSQGFDVSEKNDGQNTILTITKGFTCSVSTQESKVLFLKDDKVGEGELGEKLMLGFLTSICELKNLPKEIICVNKAVFLTTTNEKSIEIFKKLSQKGVKIYSCGVCLEFFGLQEDLKIGEIGNAFSTVDTLMKSEGVISL